MSATKSMRDRTIVAVVGVAVLWAMAAAFWFFGQENAWKVARRKYERERNVRVQQQKLISERAKWFDAYETERSKMPTFTDDERGVDTHWLNVMDAVAQDNHVSISRRQAGKEAEVGDVFEMPVDVKDWTGSLQCLVKFLFDLEHAEGAMFDVSAISMKPDNKGYMRGSFTLACAYMRGKEE